MKKKIIIAVAIIITAAVAFGLYENQQGINKRVGVVQAINDKISAAKSPVVVSLEGLNYKHVRITDPETIDADTRLSFMRSLSRGGETVAFRSSGITKIILCDGKNEWVFNI